MSNTSDKRIKIPLFVFFVIEPIVQKIVEHIYENECMLLKSYTKYLITQP